MKDVPPEDRKRSIAVVHDQVTAFMQGGWIELVEEEEGKQEVPDVLNIA